MPGSFLADGVAADLRGVRVLIATSGHSATEARIYARQAHGLQRLGASVTVVGMHDRALTGDVRVVPLPRPASRLTRFLWQPWRCLWSVRSERFDIVHFHDAEMLMTLPLARLWWPGTKFVYDVHEDFANLLLIRDWLPSWVKAPLRRAVDTAEKVMALLAHGVVGVTAPLTQKFWNRRRITAHNYVPQQFFEEAGRAARPPREREFDLVHLGTLSTPRARFLADTISAFHRLHPAARSLVVGVSPQIEETMRPRVPPGCTLLRRRRYDEVPALLGNAKVGLDVHPSLEPHLEVAYPVKIGEYMAAGCGVVSSQLPVLTEILAETRAGADLVTIGEGAGPGDYARAVLELVRAIDSGDDPGARLREVALKHMTWEDEVVKIAELYVGLLNGR